MTDSKQMKKNEENNGVNPVVAAAVSGVVVGAGLAIAGAVAFNDKGNRAKIDTAVNEVKKQAADYIEDVKTQVADKKKEADAVFAEGNEKAAKINTIIKE